VLDADALSLDPQRVEFVGYAEPRPAAPAMQAVAPAVTSDADQAVPPTGTITDIGRRPPGARPIDPDAPRRPLPPPPDAASAATDPAAGLAPAAAGADVWNLVTVPPSAAPAASGRGSRTATLFLSLLVALVIVALVIGFLYMFTELI
jgi:hypothetical protein